VLPDDLEPGAEGRVDAELHHCLERRYRRVDDHLVARHQVVDALADGVDDSGDVAAGHVR
jgi:hypothetical protein